MAAKIERNTQQNNKDNQGLFAATSSKFHALAIIRQHEDEVPTMPVYMPGEGGSCSTV